MKYLKLLYCAYKQLYKKDGDYYSTGSFPDFLPSLSKFFEKIYLMVPVNKHMVNGVSKLAHSEQLKIVETKMYKIRYLRYMLSYIWSFMNVLKFNRLQKDVDVVLIAIPSTMLYLAYIPFINKPLVTLIAGDEQEVLLAQNTPLLKLERFLGLLKLRESMENCLVNKSDVIICMNNKFKEKLIQKYNVPESIINVIAIGVKTNLFKPVTSNEKEKIRHDLGLKKDDIVIGFAATHISHSKGADILKEVFEKVKTEYLNVKLLLIGDDMIGIKNNDSIINCGLVKREKLQNLYNAMDIFVFPSRSEGAPKVVMEACACGLPVISSKVGGIPELITEGETGFTVESGDIAGIIHYCQLLIKNAGLRVEMGRKAREYAVKHFDFDDLVNKSAKIIKSEEI